jgi:hypothetical protein
LVHFCVDGRGRGLGSGWGNTAGIHSGRNHTFDGYDHRKSLDLAGDDASGRFGAEIGQFPEPEKAKETAKATGNVTTQIGKYGTPQNVYNGTNGLTVVEETAGRNAGKIITGWWR